MHNFKKFPELTNKQMQTLYFESPHKQIFEDFVAKVVKVTDGDTITLKWNERNFNFKLRLAKIATPELKEQGGVEARKALVELIMGEEIQIMINTKNRVGKFGRLIGEIMHRGININQEMINKGFAVPFGQISGKIEEIRSIQLTKLNQIIKQW